MRGYAVDDLIQQKLCRLVSADEPVKIIFRLPHRLRPTLHKTREKEERAREAAAAEAAEAKLSRSDGSLSGSAGSAAPKKSDGKWSRSRSMLAKFKSSWRTLNRSMHKKSGTYDERRDALIQQWKSIRQLCTSDFKAALSKAKKMVKKSGIPDRVRGETWFVLLGNPLRITPGLFDYLNSRVSRGTSKHSIIAEKIKM